ncbi:MAG: glycosyltransferase family 9 protein, partial [Bacteroidia bacterium]
LQISDFVLSDQEETSSASTEYIVIQVSAGNNKAPYKTWPARHWVAFIRELLNHYKQNNIVLLGDKNEKGFEDELTIKDERLTSLIGKTTIEQAMQVIGGSSLFVGLDGGLMHLAVVLNKPTFTIWGGSDPELYGYEKIDSKRHKVIRKEISCHPCNSWIAPNITKTSEPAKCPDFACLVTLSPYLVFKSFRVFFESLNTHAE